MQSPHTRLDPRQQQGYSWQSCRTSWLGCSDPLSTLQYPSCRCAVLGVSSSAWLQMLLCMIILLGCCSDRSLIGVPSRVRLNTWLYSGMVGCARSVLCCYQLYQTRGACCTWSAFVLTDTIGL